MVQILLLNGRHNRKDFDCGAVELNLWLVRMARQHLKRRLAITYVAASSATSPTILGYYTISLAELRAHEASWRWRQRLPLRIPAFRIGRLAVASHYQRAGLGRLLLADAFTRIERLAAEIGGVGVIVDAKPSALAFYQHYGFEQLADHPTQLFLPLYTITDLRQQEDN
ncbi:GNAT family N-acetyltransferase [Pseudoduganella danionis]|uniref:GNAT family N-acetyltransferase n=1 Tax=Pseudoduganella danionis TaxID=1890295 RepID=UPI0035B4AD29